MNANEKLTERQRAWLVNASALIDRARKIGSAWELDFNRGKLRGFLECLCNSGQITATELKELYAWYFQKDRR